MPPIERVVSKLPPNSPLVNVMAETVEAEIKRPQNQKWQDFLNAYMTKGRVETKLEAG